MQDSFSEDFDILSNLLIKNRILDYGTLQNILNTFLNSNFEEGSNLYKRILAYVERIYNYERSLKVVDDLSARSVSLAILAVDSLIFNTYTKSKNSEANRLGQSVYASSRSLSGSYLLNKSQSSLDPFQQSPEMHKFLGFFQQFIECTDIFELLSHIIEEYKSTEFIGDIAHAIKTLIETLDYVIKKESCDKSIYSSNKLKFVVFFDSADEKKYVKPTIPKIKRVLFKGTARKIIELLSIKEKSQQIQFSMLRILYDSNSGANTPISSNQQGSDLFSKLLIHSLKNTTDTKDMLFRGNRSSDRVFDFLMNYLTYKFLPEAKAFWKFFNAYVMPYAESKPQEFYQTFQSKNGDKVLIKYLDNLSDEFKSFLRDIQAIITALPFKDKTDSNIPIRHLFVFRFLSPEIRALVLPNSNPSDDKSVLTGLNYIKDLFYESSKQKYEGNQQFSNISKEVISKFQAICQQSSNLKKGLGDGVKYFIMKPILYYDYEIVGHSMLVLNLSEPDDDEAAEEDILLQSYKSVKDMQVSPRVEKENFIDSRASKPKLQENSKSERPSQQIPSTSKNEPSQSKGGPIFAQEEPIESFSEQDGFRITFQKTANDRPVMTRSVDLNRKRSAEQQNPSYEKEIRELQQKIEQLTKNLSEGKTSSIQSIEHAYNTEKLELLQQISVLQQRIAQLSDTIPVLNTIYNGGSSPGKAQYGKTQKRQEYQDENDEFYKLSAELEEGYREILAAEQQYILHKKFNLPSETF